MVPIVRRHDTSYFLTCDGAVKVINIRETDDAGRSIRFRNASVSGASLRIGRQRVDTFKHARVEKNALKISYTSEKCKVLVFL